MYRKGHINPDHDNFRFLDAHDSDLRIVEFTESIIKLRNRGQGKKVVEVRRSWPIERGDRPLEIPQRQQAIWDALGKNLCSYKPLLQMAWFERYYREKFGPTDNII